MKLTHTFTVLEDITIDALVTFLQSFLLESLVSCDGCDTSRNHTRPPIRADWVLDGRVQPDQDSMLICVVDIVNVNGNEDPQWGDGSTTQMTVMVKT